MSAYRPGERYVTPGEDTLERRMREADRPGEHLWTVTALWRVAPPPGGPMPDGPAILDAENLLMIAGPGCFKCEHPYSARLARKPCRG